VISFIGTSPGAFQSKKGLLKNKRRFSALVVGENGYFQMRIALRMRLLYLMRLEKVSVDGLHYLANAPQCNLKG